MKYSVLIAQTATGLILNTDGKSCHSGTHLPYVCFDSFDEIKNFASGITSPFGQLEFIVHDEFNEYLKMIYPVKI